MSGKRLGGGFGRLIDRGAPLDFRFGGTALRGLRGDVIASALAANGVWALSRSFKYRRPRGLFSLAGHEANTIVDIAGEPNVYADLRELEAGMRVRPQNSRGLPQRAHPLALLNYCGRFLPPGFYYAAFFRPRGAWRVWEPLIRRLAGLGTVDEESRHRAHDKVYDWCDVAVVGGGIAGMNAAIAAAAGGAETLLIEESPLLGGALNYARETPEAGDAEAMRARLKAKVRAAKNIRLLMPATVTGLFADNWLAAVAAGRMHKIRARAVVVASGTVEQPAVFRNNDLPGVFAAAAAQKLMRLYAVSPGKRGAILTANDGGYGLALDCAEAGVGVAAVLDLRAKPPPSPLADAAREAGISVRANCGVRGAVGGSHLRALRLFSPDGDGGGRRTLDCDFLGVSAGNAGNGALLHYGGAKFRYDEKLAAHIPCELPPNVYAAGSVCGANDFAAAAEQGARVGELAAKNKKQILTLAASSSSPSSSSVSSSATVKNWNHPHPVFAHPRGKDFVDFDEDLQTSDITASWDDGYRDIQLLKRYSTLGMGPSQGRHSQINAMRLLARYVGNGNSDDGNGSDADAIGVTTSRPPYRAESIAHLAGRAFEPEKRTPMHYRHLENGAEMTVAGLWLRPAFYGGERVAAAAEEARRCRSEAGMIDLSTLGKIEVFGADAAEFVNRMYTWNYLKQAVGKARYLLMTSEDGIITDDGVACRLAADRFYLTATTGNAEGVFRAMLRHNAEWGLRVHIVNLTSARAGVNLAGPRAKEILEKLCEGTDLSAEGFPYLAVREAKIAGMPALLLRVGFVGEWGCEIHVPASCGESLWDALAREGARPFGVEAQRLMRLEKGHIIVGQDTDGLTTPVEAAMEWAVGKNKPYFVGQRAVEIRRKQGAAQRLAGFELAEKNAPCPEECDLVVNGNAITGRVTSAARSPSLGKVVGLAYVLPEQCEPGTGFMIRAGSGKLIEAVCAKTPFYDPENARQK